MKILLITQEPPLRDAEIVSGNAVRTGQLQTALKSAGHSVTQVWLKSPRSAREEKRGLSFRNQDELQGILLKQNPEAVLVGYWELLAMVPFGLTIPVILDYVAPRSLEELYESPETVKSSLRRLRNNLKKCDLVLVGNPLQRHLLINTLIEAGFDLRAQDPVRVVPLGATIATPPVSDPGKDGWLLVSGGVDWPWRDDRVYRTELEAFAVKRANRFRIVRFGGGYRWHIHGEGPASKVSSAEGPVEYRELLPYREFCNFLSQNAHIGVELGDCNVEREFSQSFRSLEFLRHGLPLLCNSYLPLSSLVERYDAGWIVDEPASLGPLLSRIVAQPGEWRKKSANAQKLVTEQLQPESSVEPLLSWLKHPVKALRLEPVSASRDSAPVLGVPPLPERIRRQFSLVRTVLLNKLLGQDRGPGVLIITRGDLFPPDHGAAVRTVETARALARRGIPVGIVTDNRKHWFEITPDGLINRNFPIWTRFLSLPGPVTKLLHFSKDLPYSNSFLYLPLTDGSFFWRIMAAARVLHPGVLQAEFPAYAQPCIRAREALQCKVVLVEHNVEYDRIKAQVETLSPSQYSNLRMIETELCNRSDAVVCVSDNDRQKLADDGVNPDLLTTIPHGVDLVQFDTSGAIDARGKFDIPADSPLLVFHGTFSYPPNQEALRIFAEILLPGLEKKGLKCHLLAVGRSPPTVSPHARIHFSGSVEQVGPWLKAADMAVIPLIEGGGTRMKIIDCFAARLPVISTSKGIEGIPVVSGRQALVLDDWDAMMAAVADLVHNPEKASALASEGRQLADGMDWDAVAEKYARLYASAG